MTSIHCRIRQTAFVAIITAAVFTGTTDIKSDPAPGPFDIVTPTESTSSFTPADTVTPWAPQ